jgi:hypothetical protein
MLMKRLVASAVVVAIAIAGCVSTEDPILSNPLDPSNGHGLPIPDSLVVVVSSNMVQLSWRVDAPQTVDEYAVFRRWLNDPAGSPEQLLARVTQMTYLDGGARNGRAYQYRVAAGRSGQFGTRSDPAFATPALYSILLVNGAERTRERTIQVSLNAQRATAVRLSEDPNNFETPGRPHSAMVPWTLSDGDAEKTVYAVFHLDDGSETAPVSDAIVLDTRALVSSVSFEGPDVVHPGEFIRFTINAGESGGEAAIDVPGLFTALPLFDDGTNGDASAGDGVYQRRVLISAALGVMAATVTGKFTDEAGNVAAPVNSLRTLTVQSIPTAVTLYAPTVHEPPDPTGATLRWSQSTAADFAAYRIYRSESARVDSTSHLAGSVPLNTTAEFTDSGITEGVTYSYRVYVLTMAGVQVGSNPVQASIPNVRPPEAVVLQTPDAVSTSRIALGWTRSTERDFASYLVFRNLTGAVSSTDSLLATISNVDVTHHDDIGLTENTNYYYRVIVKDRGDLEARSNESHARTHNIAPPAVVLQPGSAVDNTGVTLSWSESSAHDFAHYRLHRDSTPTVTSSSDLVVEIDERGATSVRDSELQPGQTYYYRVFVTDDGETPGPSSTGSNTIVVTTPTESTAWEGRNGQ